MTNLDRNLMKAFLTGIGSVLLLMAWGWAFWLLASCHRDRPEIIPPSTVKTVNLYLFAAGYCGPCKEELPEVQKWYDSYGNSPRIRTTVYFVAGNPASKPATQEDAIAFSNGLGLTFKTLADKYARFYRTYYTSGTAVPATVIADEEGKAIKIYRPGIVSVSTLEKDINEIISRRHAP